MYSPARRGLGNDTLRRLPIFFFFETRAQAKFVLSVFGLAGLRSLFTDWILALKVWRVRPCEKRGFQWGSNRKNTAKPAPLWARVSGTWIVLAPSTEHHASMSPDTATRCFPVTLKTKSVQVLFLLLPLHCENKP